MTKEALRLALEALTDFDYDKRMSAIEVIKEEIIELYGATQALSEAMNFLHAQRMEKSKQMMALNHMLKEMEDKND